MTTQVGSVILLEGLPGSGKTEVLSGFAARTLPRTAVIHFTAASPYQAKKPFGGWSIVLQQYLDTLCRVEVGRCSVDGNFGGICFVGKGAWGDNMYLYYCDGGTWILADWCQFLHVSFFVLPV